MKYIFRILVFTLLFSCSATKAQDYKTHKVAVGESIEDIAKKYMVTPFDLYALNPDAKSGLKVNSVLIIPKTKLADVPKVTQVQEVKDYKEHKVKRKETLFSISQKYNVSVEDLKKHNKHLYAENLRKGERIKIPLFKTVLKEEKLSNTIKKYKVQPKEGKITIAYKFGMTVDHLNKLNPSLGDNLSIGQEINVRNIADNEIKQIDPAYKYYQVKQSEGFYAIERKLGFDQALIESLNPDVKTTGLKSGMVLKIPVPEGLGTAEVGSSDNPKTDLTNSLTNVGTKRLAVMLPFRLNRVDMDSIQEIKRKIQTDPYLRSALDFHSGVLMALDAAKDKGISTVLDVYDTQNLAPTVSSILSSNDFSNTDAVIGPFMKKHVDKVSGALAKTNTPVFVPLAKDFQLRSNVYQTVPTDQMLFERIVNFVKADSTDKHIIIISDAKNKAIGDKLKKEFVGAKQIQSRKNKEGKDAYYILLEDIEEEFKEGKNIVFLNTSNEGFVSNVSSMLNSFNADETRDIILMTTNRNRGFEGENISNYHLSNLKFHYPSVNKPLADDADNEFVKKYKAEYGVAPNKFAARGYDLTLDVLLRLASEDTILNDVEEPLTTEYSENKFQYNKKLFGGFYNNATYIVKYDDLNIVEAN